MRSRALPLPPALLPPGADQARVWVLQDANPASGQPALAVAERLGVPFRHLRLTWNWLAPMAVLRPAGSLLGLADVLAEKPPILAGPAPAPLLLLSDSRRAAAVARWLGVRLGCALVHCAATGSGLARLEPGSTQYGLLVVPGLSEDRTGGNTMSVLGVPHRLGPGALYRAEAQWEDRLDHLPHPRVALLLGGRPWGTDMEPARAHLLGRRVAAAAVSLGGSVMASTSPRTGAEAADALEAGLAKSVHLLHRWDEPGESPSIGSLALADAVVVAGDAPDLLLAACATRAPVYAALPELHGPSHRRLAAALARLDHVRPFHGGLQSWHRARLDEAGRVAAEIRLRFRLA